MVTDFDRERCNELCIAMNTKEASAPTGGDEDDVYAEYGVREPGVEAVEGSHFQRGIKYTSDIRHTDTQVRHLLPPQPHTIQAPAGRGSKPDGLFHRLADDVGGGPGLGQGREVDDPLDGLVVLPAGAQQVEQGGEEDHLHINTQRDTFSTPSITRLADSNLKKSPSLLLLH